jgi:hypothetical protein
MPTVRKYKLKWDKFDAPCKQSVIKQQQVHKKKT